MTTAQPEALPPLAGPHLPQLEPTPQPEPQPDPPRDIQLWRILPGMNPEANWSDEMLEEWSLQWPYYQNASKLPYRDARRYYNSTSTRLGNKKSWHDNVRILGPILIAAALAFVIYLWFIRDKGYLALGWYWIPILSGLGGFVSFFLIQELLKVAMWPIIFGRATVSYRRLQTKGIHSVKTVTHYPRLSRLTQPGIHRGPIQKGGLVAGSITIPIYLDETPIDANNSAGPKFTHPHQLTWEQAMRMPAEHRDDTFLERGFTLRTTQTIYGKLKRVTLHGEIEGGAGKLARRILTELASWLPAFLVWLAILFSLLTGFSMNAAAAEYVTSLPDSIQILLEGM